jgi:hypothetical protein
MKIIVSLIIVFATSDCIASSWPMPKFEDCSFYPKVEKVLNCSGSGHDYLLSYGFHYCEEFRTRSKTWSPKGQAWTKDTMLCLQEMLKDNKDKRLSPCSQLKDFAFDAHPICYKQYKVCDLSLSDQLSIISTVRFLDYFTQQAVLQTLNVAVSCIGELISKEENATFKRMIEATASYSSDERRAASKVFDLAPTSSIADRRKYFKNALSLLIGSRDFDVSPNVVGLYSSKYGTASSSFETDQPFFACSKTVALSGNVKGCPADLAQDFKKVSRKEAIGISSSVSPKKLNEIVEALAKSGTK